MVEIFLDIGKNRFKYIYDIDIGLEIVILYFCGPLKNSLNIFLNWWYPPLPYTNTTNTKNNKQQ